MTKCIPSPRDWFREQVELDESSGGTKGTTLRDTDLPVIIVTHIGNQTGAVHKTPLMRIKDGDAYVLVRSQGGAPYRPKVCTISAAIPPLIYATCSMHIREAADTA